MSTRVFSSPRTASAAAAIAPARLAAATTGTSVRWRTRSDGSLELLTLRDGTAERSLVNDDGTTTPLESVALSFWYRWGKRIVLLGWSIGLLSVVVGGLTDRPFVVLGWAIGAAIFVGAAAAHTRAEAVERLFGGGWHEPTDLHGWVPRSASQLAVVERIADDHDGLVYIRDVGGRAVDVYAMRKGDLVLHWVDEHGDTGITSVVRDAGRHSLDRVLKGLVGLLWIGLFGVLVVVDEHKFLLAGLLAASLAVVLYAGSRNSKRLDLGALVRQRAPDGSEWLEIRTKLEEDSGD